MRGIIAEVKNKKAVFLSESGEFHTIVNKNYEVGEKIEYYPQTYRSLYSIAACFVILLFCGFTGYSMYKTPAAYISIDINPSIQLDINRFNKIIDARPINDDAKTLLQAINVKNKSIREGVDKIIQASEDMGYLSEKNNHVEIDIVSRKSDMIEQVGSYMNKYKFSKINVYVGKADENDMALSNELGISIGRAKAIREYTEFYGGDTRKNAEELSDLSVGEVKKSVKKSTDINNDKKSNDNSSDKDRKSIVNDLQNSGVNKKSNGNNSNNGKKSIVNDSNNNREPNDSDSGNSDGNKKSTGNNSNNGKKSIDNDSSNSGKDKNSDVNPSRKEVKPDKNPGNEKIKGNEKSRAD